jgi:hypothetical protein
LVHCANCGERLLGAYCHACGQKRLAEGDRRLGHLLRQFVEVATDLDNRVWRSLRALVFEPGRLTREYFLGRRARWIAPIPLFLAVNLVYFLAPLHGGDLSLQFDQQVTARVRILADEPEPRLDARQRLREGQSHSPHTTAWIDARVRERDAAARSASQGTPGYTYRDYRIAYDAKADEVSKALIILHVPFAALALTVMFATQRRYFAEHFVFALHYFAFLLLALQVAAQVYGLLQSTSTAPSTHAVVVLDWAMRGLIPAYAVLSIRRAYAVGWPMAFAAAIGLVGTILAVNLHVYRAVQFAITFALT